MRTVESVEAIQHTSPKRRMRKVLEHHIFNRWETGLVGLTLPGTSFALERSILNHYGAHARLIGLEANRRIYKAGAEQIEKLNLTMEYHHTLDLNYITEDVWPFDFMWLDYCGQWAQGKHDSIDKIFKYGLIVPENGPGLLAITIMATRDLTTEVFDLADHDRYVDYRMDGIPKLINNIANEHNSSIVPIGIYRYRDRSRASHASPMIMFVFNTYDYIEKDVVWDPYVENTIS